MLRPKELISSFSGTATSCHMLMHFIFTFTMLKRGINQFQLSYSPLQITHLPLANIIIFWPEKLKINLFFP